MKIKNLVISCTSALDVDETFDGSVCILRGSNSALALDLIRELIGDYGAIDDPDRFDDGRFVIHSDIDIDGKNYSICYIRNADYLGDNRIAANFTPCTLEFSEDDTDEFVKKCNTLDTDSSNVIYGAKMPDVSTDARPVFVYLEDGCDTLDGHTLAAFADCNRQVFIAAPEDFSAQALDGVQTVSVR